MAFLKPDSTYDANGIKVNVKFLPKATGKWKAGTRPGTLLNTPNNNPKWITVHNTAMINYAAGTTAAEQYSRSTFNGNMGDVVVHFYIDSKDCWQITPMNEIGYHAADLGNKNGGNWTSVSIEIIEKDGKTAEDKLAEARAAKLIVFLLKKYGLTTKDIKTHKDWSGKYCPAYILPHWASFMKSIETEYAPAVKEVYRIRKTWPNASTQVGAYNDLTNAINACKKLTGYSVFDSSGKAVYVGPIAVPGDIDGDGKVTVSDARDILRIAIKLDKESPNADINGDGKVDLNDARDALRKATGEK